MKRRDFLKIAGLTPAAVMIGCNKSDDSETGKIEEVKNFDVVPQTQKRFPYLEVFGSYEEIGFQIGRNFGDNIRNVMEQQPEWINKLTEMVSTGPGKEYSDSLMAAVEKHFPHLLEEMRGMARGAELEEKVIWAMTIKSELDAFAQQNPGCSTVYVKRGDLNWLFHNEDGHKAYKNNMFVLKAGAPSCVTFTSLVYAGLLAGVGPSMNNYGIVETTNFIGCTKPGVGIPRYYLGRAVLESKTLDEAVKIATMEPRAFPWHHHLASMKTGEYVSVETLPDGRKEIRKPENIYIHTNHLTGANTTPYEYEDEKYKKLSSLPRYNVLNGEVEKLNRPIESPYDIIKWLSSHEGLPYSPCRHPQDDIHGLTLGTAWFDLTESRMRLFKGNPCLASGNDFYTDYFSGS